jgi:RNA recognition motif-containing protein
VGKAGAVTDRDTGVERRVKIYVANFDKYTDEENLQALFSQYGAVTDVDMFRDRNTEEPLGYAFIEMPDDWDADRAIKHLHGRFWNGRRLKVSERRPRDRDD